MIQRLVRLPLIVLALAAAAPAAAQETPTTLAEALRADPALTQLTALLDESGLLAQLEQPFRFTFFAPSDRALERLDEATLEMIRRDKGVLDLVVRHHLTVGASPLTALRRLDAVTTLEGTQLVVRVEGDTVRVGGVRLTGDGVTTGNGVLYVIDRVLQPDAALLRKDLLGGPNAP